MTTIDDYLDFICGKKYAISVFYVFKHIIIIIIHFHFTYESMLWINTIFEKSIKTKYDKIVIINLNSNKNDKEEKKKKNAEYSYIFFNIIWM